MTTTHLKNLIQALNPLCRQTLEAAAGTCFSAGHYSVEIEHWLLKLLDANKSDLALIVEHYALDKSKLITALEQKLSRLKTGRTQAPTLSKDLINLIYETMLVTESEFGAVQIRSAYLLYTWLTEQNLNHSELTRIKPEILRQELARNIKDSSENTQEIMTVESIASALEKYTINLTRMAQDGKIDPVLGRDEEIRQVIDILMRRRQNNPILTGEPGVGKTAIVEGLALRIASGDMPTVLQNVAIHMLDMGLLQAGSSTKGEFESRLKSVITAVKNAPKPVILFIDEAHTLVGAGGQAGQNDAANLLKPALARGELRTIAATTWSEYKKYFEQDAALTRRFQVVTVSEPSEEIAVSMLRGLVKHLEQHHGVRILDEALTAAVYLSSRYIPHRQLPDKAISLLDTACARMAISEASHSPELAYYQAKLQQIDAEITLLSREVLCGLEHQTRLQELYDLQQHHQASLQALQLHWQKEKELINTIRMLRQQLEQASLSNDSSNNRADLQKQLAKSTKKLKKLHSSTSLLQDCVDAQCIAAVVAAWTGIPLAKMLQDETRALLELQPRLQQRIKGQTHALAAIAERIQAARAQLLNPGKPLGVFFLLGPSGVGKTETALALAEILYGGVQNMSVINLSEFKEEHRVSLLLGAPPGYIGYGDGGVLTEAVRKRPYSLVLLDEIEKSHPGVQDIFYQLFDKGVLRDGQGRDIHFKNTLLILTSNVGSELITQLCSKANTTPDMETLIQALKPDLIQFFKPAFLARITLIPYLPLSETSMREIIKLQLMKIQHRITQQYSAVLTYADSVILYIEKYCNQKQFGARTIEHVLTDMLLPKLSVYLLTQVAKQKKIKAVHITIDPQQGFICEHK